MLQILTETLLLLTGATLLALNFASPDVPQNYRTAMLIKCVVHWVSAFALLTHAANALLIIAALTLSLLYAVGVRLWNRRHNWQGERILLFATGKFRVAAMATLLAIILLTIGQILRNRDKLFQFASAPARVDSVYVLPGRNERNDTKKWDDLKTQNP